MLVKTASSLKEDDLIKLKKEISSLGGGDAAFVRCKSATYLIVVGGNKIDLREVKALDGVVDVFRVTDPYVLVSSQWRTSPTVLTLPNNESIGGGSMSLMLGPCSIANEAQIESIINFLKSQEIKVIRGGAFKPRTNPYSFQGLGIEGLKMLYKYAKGAGICVISEVMEPNQIEQMHDFVDLYQVGARNNQNFNLLKALGGTDKPVLLKRGISGTIDELLNAAEYVFSSGNDSIILCERGIRSFETAYRNVFDINAVAYLKNKSHLPVVVDPSHAVGVRSLVEPIALAATLAGADGLLVEIEEVPEKALSDGQQTLNFKEAQYLISKSREVLNLRKKFLNDYI
jgi:3-deoxy-7-phosphoheptulonate synthase